LAAPGRAELRIVLVAHAYGRRASGTFSVVVPGARCLDVVPCWTNLACCALLYDVGWAALPGFEEPCWTVLEARHVWQAVPAQMKCMCVFVCVIMSLQNNTASLDFGSSHLVCVCVCVCVYARAFVCVCNNESAKQRLEEFTYCTCFCRSCTHSLQSQQLRTLSDTLCTQCWRNWSTSLTGSSLLHTSSRLYTACMLVRCSLCSLCTGCFLHIARLGTCISHTLQSPWYPSHRTGWQCIPLWHSFACSSRTPGSSW
jgi:hypothetical protein